MKTYEFETVQPFPDIAGAHVALKSNLTSLVDQFGAMLDSYTDEGDVPYWYGELALNGLLASSAWRAGGWALQEFLAPRRQPSRPRRSMGRGDLWIGLPDVTQPDFLTCEAKYLPIRDDQLEQLRPWVKRKLRRARAQIRSIDHGPYRSDLSLAICYVVPYSRRAADSKRTFASAVEKFRKPLRRAPTAVASFAHRNGGPRDQESDEHASYPGVIVLVQVLSNETL